MYSETRTSADVVIFLSQVEFLNYFIILRVVSGVCGLHGITEPARALADGAKFMPSKSRPFASLFSNSRFIAFLDVITRKKRVEFLDIDAKRLNPTIKYFPNHQAIYTKCFLFRAVQDRSLSWWVCKNVVCQKTLSSSWRVLSKFRGTPSVSYGSKINAICKWVFQDTTTGTYSLELWFWTLPDQYPTLCVLCALVRNSLDGWIAWLSIISPGLQRKLPTKKNLFLSFSRAPLIMRSISEFLVPSM